MTSAKATHYAEISGADKRNCFCSDVQNDLENSLPDLTVCINKFCWFWKEPEGNGAVPESWHPLQGLHQQDECCHCAEGSVLGHSIIRSGLISFSIKVISLIHFSSSY